MPLTPGDIVVDRYRIEGLLGEGGMGAVYRAFDTLHKRPCALKESRLGYLPSEAAVQTPDSTAPRSKPRLLAMTREKAIEQFKREAQLLASLDHPRLPKVTDYFAVGDDYYLVMTLIEGTDLAAILEDAGGRPLPEGQVLAWMEQVEGALDYCHRQGVIHRDVKPANMILTPESQVYLVDFGIAKPADGSGKTTLGARAVTPGYSPPEQYEGQGLTDARSDIYALGATMYALLTGRAPVEAISRLRGAPLPSPRSLDPGISPAVDDVVMRALALDPAQRFASAGELCSALSAPALAPKSPRTDLRRLARPAMIALAIGAALFLACGGLGLAGLAGRGIWRLVSPTFTPALGEAVYAVTATHTPAAATTAPKPNPTPDAVVRTLKAELREGPAESFRVFREYARDTALTVLGRVVDESWFQVRPPDGLNGWMLAEQILVNKPREEIAVVPTPRYEAGILAMPTLSPLAAPRPTDTPKPPTATPRPTDTPKPPTAAPRPTDTPKPPTAAPRPTDTPKPPTATPRPTDTPKPPTATPRSTDTPKPPTEAPDPIVNFWADQTSLEAGQCTRLRWQVQNARQVYLEGQGVAGQGEKQVCPGQTTTYTLRVVGYRRTDEHRLEIRVTPVQPPSAEFWADVSEYCEGQQLGIHWRTQRATQVLIDGALQGSVNGDDARIPDAPEHVFTLVARGPGGEVSKTIKLYLIPRITNVSAPGSVNRGQAFTISWDLECCGSGYHYIEWWCLGGVSCNGKDVKSGGQGRYSQTISAPNTATTIQYVIKNSTGYRNAEQGGSIQVK